MWCILWTAISHLALVAVSLYGAAACSREHPVNYVVSGQFSLFSRFINGLGRMKDLPKVTLRSAFPKAVW